jgi:hypothetical protein
MWLKRINKEALQRALFCYLALNNSGGYTHLIISIYKVVSYTTCMSLFSWQTTTNKALFCVSLVGLFFSWTYVSYAQSIPTVDLDGYAWSSTIGWISLNCATGGTGGSNVCATSNYKVTINSNRTVTGYAWSSTVGWIRFGGLSAFPAGSGTTAANAAVTGTYPNLTFTGWARACAGTASPAGTCDTMANNSVGGGWDGWISLQGTGYAVAANMSSGFTTPSYAWGSQVVGWIDMHSRTTFAAISATINGTGCTIATAGQSSCTGALSWNINPAAILPNIYRTETASQFSTAYSNPGATPTLQLGTNTFEARSDTAVLATRALAATCGAGLLPVAGVCQVDPATVAPTITVRPRPPIVRAGETVSINWTISDITTSTCTMTGPGVSGTSITAVSGTIPSGALRGLSTFTITCTGAYGSASGSAKVEVIPVANEV